LIAYGVTGSHAMGQSVGVFSYSTLNKYRSITCEFLQWCRNNHNIKNAEKITPALVEEWLQVKIASGVRYKSFSTYAAALNKASVGLREIYKRDPGWSAAIDSTRTQAKVYCSRDVKSRGYLRPQALIDRLSGIHRIAAELQYQGGARVKEVCVFGKPAMT
jgi:site-specific recombinase XerD